MSATALGGSVVPPPPAFLECSMHVMPAGAIVHRIHDARFRATDFNPGYGASRFAPFEIAGRKVPTAYAATTLDCAIFETIFHDVEPSATIKSVSWSAILPLRHSTLVLRRDLSLARLFSADLMKWGLERRQLIDTARSGYAAARAWVPIIHDAPTSPDGMIWVSRRFDEERALMLFGSRVDPAEWRMNSSVEVANDPHVLQALNDLAERAGILIIR